MPYRAPADELREDGPPHTTENTLQAHIARLRRLLEDTSRPDAPQTVNQGYLLDLSPDVIDAERFHRLASSGAQRVTDHPQVQRRYRAILDQDPALTAPLCAA
ncbi:helix-turn-helix domain-containing protein [Streptomyces sp. NPDC050388]|uniref:AfsR/SARP family transcriptional regulator n=1 Tax=Streptomyces sp. NPDC050388 TaxID=3155781 RepID=UPI00341CC838